MLSHHQLIIAGRTIGYRLSLANEPIAEDALTPGELAQLHMRHKTAQHAWRLGRAALIPLFQLVSGGADTSQLQFPYPRLSLSHTHQLGAAVALVNGPVTAASLRIGLDIEAPRPLDVHRAGRFCLTPTEQHYLATQTDGCQVFARLWTVKEALFKASLHPDRVLTRYKLEDPAQLSGLAGQCNGEQFYYNSQWLAGHGHWLTIVIGGLSL